MNTPHILTLIVGSKDDQTITSTVCESFDHAKKTLNVMGFTYYGLAGYASLYVLKNGDDILAQAKIERMTGE